MASPCRQSPWTKDTCTSSRARSRATRSDGTRAARNRSRRRAPAAGGAQARLAAAAALTGRRLEDVSGARSAQRRAVIERLRSTSRELVIAQSSRQKAARAVFFGCAGDLGELRQYVFDCVVCVCQVGAEGAELLWHGHRVRAARPHGLRRLRRPHGLQCSHGLRRLNGPVVRPQRASRRASDALTADGHL